MTNARHIVYMRDTLKRDAFNVAVDGAIDAAHAVTIAEVYFASARTMSVIGTTNTRIQTRFTLSLESLEGWWRCVALARQVGNGATRRCYGYATSSICRYCDQ